MKSMVENAAAVRNAGRKRAGGSKILADSNRMSLMDHTLILENGSILQRLPRSQILAAVELRTTRMRALGRSQILAH